MASWFLTGLKTQVATMAEMHTAVPNEPVAEVAVAVAEAPAPTPVRREPVPVPEASIEPVTLMTDDLRRQYSALAAELGISQPGLLEDEALAFFRERGTRLYDQSKVNAFLTDQFGAEIPATEGQRQHYGIHTIATWGWRALRRVDVEGGGGGWHNPSSNGAHIGGLYNKPLPLPVLLTVKEVAARFPSAMFFVSDEVHSSDLRRVDDPFLLVLIERTRFIIERWDEPGYRE